MDKIKSLLERSGCKPELLTAICTTLEEYKRTVKEEFEKDTKAKIAEAKRICLEETENYKRELARRVQIFCETKAAGIEAHLAKQSAVLESEATAKLKQISTMVEGLNDAGSVSPAVLEKAKRQIQAANENKNRAIEKANRQTQIAEKLLQHNKQLVSELATVKRQIGQTTVVENKRLDTNRSKPAKSVTTRSTITENQSLRAAPAKGAPRNAFGIDSIAAQMEEIV